jgi:hypothetical protein
MTPFGPKGLINSNLSARLPGGPEEVDGFPSGHPDGGHPGLLKSVPKGVLIVKVLSASFRPKKIEDEATKDVERLPGVGEAAGMVLVTIEGVVFSFEDHFTQKNEGPREGDVVRCPPFLPDLEEGLPGAFGVSAFQETMLKRFGNSVVTNLARQKDPHTLQPGANEKTSVQSEPDKSAHFAGVGAVPDYGHHLGVRRILKI